MTRVPPACAAALALLVLGLAGCAPALKPMGPATTAPTMTDDAVVAADGARLPLRRWLPEGKAKAVILALHGFNDYSKAFAAPGAWFAANGIAVYAYDQRGFGRAPHRGYWAGTATMTADLRAAATVVKARNPDLPLYVLGESMGGAVAMAALADGAIAGEDGAILSAPAVWGRRHMNPLQSAMLWLTARLLPGLTLTGRGLGRQASDNVPMLRALGRDSLVIKETRVDTIEGLVDLMDAADAAAPRLTAAPALMLYGARDEIVPENPVLAAMRALPPGRGHRTALYDTGWHMLLRDLKAVRVWRDIAAWIADRGAPLPSGAEAAAAKALAAD
jgi:acylglycerol lipase